MQDVSAQREVFPTCLHLQRVDPARNVRRFYRMTVQRDLFGCSSLVRVWGRIGTRGREMVNTYADEGRAISFRDAGAAEARSFGRTDHVLYDLKNLYGRGESDLRL